MRVVWHGRKKIDKQHARWMYLQNKCLIKDLHLEHVKAAYLNNKTASQKLGKRFT